MTDEQFKSLRTLILDLRLEVSTLKLMLKSRYDLDDHRFNLLYEALYEDTAAERGSNILSNDEFEQLLKSRAARPSESD